MCFTAFRVYHSTVQTILSRLQQLDITTKRPRSSCPCATTARQNRNMCFTAFCVYHSIHIFLFSLAVVTRGRLLNGTENFLTIDVMAKTETNCVHIDFINMMLKTFKLKYSNFIRII
jgi:hypothetical protein